MWIHKFNILTNCLCCRRTALHCAAYGGFTECLNVLLSEGHADINLQDAEGITALHWACSAGHLDAVQLLVSSGAGVNMMEVDFERLTPLDYAIIGGHQEVAQLLIEHGALSISGIRELACIMIQRCVRGYLARKSMGPQLQEARERRKASEMAARGSGGAGEGGVGGPSCEVREGTDAGDKEGGESWQEKEKARAARRR